MKQSQINWKTVDWSRTDRALGIALGCSRQFVNVKRHELNKRKKVEPFLQGRVVQFREWAKDRSKYIASQTLYTIQKEMKIQFGLSPETVKRHLKLLGLETKPFVPQDSIRVRQANWKLPNKALDEIWGWPTGTAGNLRRKFKMSKAKFRSSKVPSGFSFQLHQAMERELKRCRSTQKQSGSN